jgi:hypothetical protein
LTELVGLTEARNANWELSGTARPAELPRRSPEASVEGQGCDLVGAIMALAGEATQFDDLAVLVVRRVYGKRVRTKTAADRAPHAAGWQRERSGVPRVDGRLETARGHTESTKFPPAFYRWRRARPTWRWSGQEHPGREKGKAE